MSDWNEDDVIKAWKKFTEGKEYQLNPDPAHVAMIAKGVLVIEKQVGFKLCPCRLQTRNMEKDITLLCPCNFFSHKTWKEKGECWCGLFCKRPDTKE